MKNSTKTGPLEAQTWELLGWQAVVKSLLLTEVSARLALEARVAELEIKIGIFEEHKKLLEQVERQTQIYQFPTDEEGGQ